LLRGLAALSTAKTSQKLTKLAVGREQLAAKIKIIKAEIGKAAI